MGSSDASLLSQHPFVQSGGLLLQGLTGTPSAYLWTAPQTAPRTDHAYSTDGTVPPGYTAEAVSGSLRQSAAPGAVALSRYVNATTGSHFYSVPGTDVPPGYSADGTLGYLDTAPAAGLVPLARHYNALTGDYLLDTSTTPPPGYTLQATLGYLRPAGTPPAGVTIAYTRNDLGQITQAQSPAVTYTYTYDAAHRLQSVTDSRGPKTLTYGYSPGGLRNSVSDSDGNQTSYLYDPVGRLIGIWAPTGDLVAFAYDAGGRLVEKSFPNGANTRYTYNPDNTLARVINRVGSSDASVISQHTYTYDGVGNRITHTERVGATTTPYAYAYDPLSRLIQVSNSATGAVLESYTYDPLGNRLTKTSGSATTYYRYDAASQLTQTCADAGCTSTTGTFTYDLSGNLVSRTDGPFTTMAYDAENRLAWINVAGQLEQAYGYDHQGRRIRKTVGGTTTQYLYDGPDIIGEYTTWASPTARTTHGPGMDHPLLRAASAGTQYFHQDGLGSVVALSNGSGGTDGTARFDAWGNKIAGTGTIPLYGYTGREPDETGLVFYRARYYDSTLGRFTQRDPIGMRGGLNLYAYVNANPINFTDPTGLMTTSQVQASQATAAASPLDPARGMTAGSSNLQAAGAQGSVTDAGWAGPPGTGTPQFQYAAPIGPNPMVSREGVAFLIQQEKLERDIYPSAEGGHSVGYGHLICRLCDLQTAKQLFPSAPLTPDQALDLLQRDIQANSVPALRSVNVALTQNQADAVASLAFNIGSPAFANSTLLRRLNEGRTDEAAVQFVQFQYSAGRFLEGLRRRRVREIQLFTRDLPPFMGP